MSNTSFYLFFASASFLFCTTCQPPNEKVDREQTFLFLGHSYDWQASDKVDPRLYYLDFGRFDGVWLGGDNCSKTSEIAAALPLLDSLFDLKSPATLWALGNHDLGDQSSQAIESRTQKPTFYTKNINNICVVVLNTNLFWHYNWTPPQEDCEEKKQQVNFFKNVLDSLQFASHLVVLHHHSLFNELKKDGEGNFIETANINPRPIRTGCDSLSSFTNEFYPQILAVQKRGIEVVFVGGDYGMVSKKFEYQTPEGIVFLGSGINNSLDMNYPPDYVSNFNPDSVLVFSNNPKKKVLKWEFVRLNDLVAAHNENDSIYSDRMKILLEEY